MPLEKIGINFSGLNNVTAPTFDIKNNSQEFINDLPIKANEISGGYFGLISLGILFFFLIWKLNQDRIDGGDHGYSSNKSIGIASSICSIIGLYALNIGYFVNFYHVVIFIVIAFISAGINYLGKN